MRLIWLSLSIFFRVITLQIVVGDSLSVTIDPRSLSCVSLRSALLISVIPLEWRINLHTPALKGKSRQGITGVVLRVMPPVPVCPAQFLLRSRPRHLRTVGRRNLIAEEE